MDEYEWQQLQVRQRAITAATWVIGVPFVAAPIVVSTWIPRAIVEEPVGVLMALIWAIGILLGIAILAGVGIGCAATRIVSHSRVSAVKLSFAMALVIDVVVFGWIVVIVCR